MVTTESVEEPRPQTTYIDAATAMVLENPFGRSTERRADRPRKEKKLDLNEHLKKEGKDFKEMLDEDIEDIDNICEKLRGVVENG